jgi:hypothetical protein
MVRFLVGSLGAALCLQLAAACGGGTAEVDQDLLPRLADTVYVEVINETMYEARVHAVYRGGSRYTLGTIDANKTVTGLEIPWQPRQLSFAIDLVIAPGAFRSDEVTVAREDLVELRIPANIQTSGFFVRVR